MTIAHVMVDSEPGHIWAFLLDEEGEMIEDAYADVSVGKAPEIRAELSELGIRPPSLGRGLVGHLTGMEIPLEYRGKGLGALMLDGIVSEARRMNVRALVTTPLNPGGADPTGFYATRGFQVVSWGGWPPLMILQLGRRGAARRTR